MTEISFNKEAGYLASFSTKHQARAHIVHLKKKSDNSWVITNSFIDSKLARENNDCWSKWLQGLISKSVNNEVRYFIVLLESVSSQLQGEIFLFSTQLITNQLCKQ